MHHHQRIADTIVAAIGAAALTLSAVPAAFASDTASQAERTATVIEKATGTTGLAVPHLRESVLVTDAAGTRVEMPETGAGKLTITDPTGARVAIGLPGTADTPARTSANGTVVYSQPQGPVDVAAQAGRDGSASALVTLKDATAPTEYRFPLDLPDGAHAMVLEEGGVVIGDSNGEVIGFFGIPWARDAMGKTVPTSYRIEGATLIQTVRADASTAYPVVTDPKWWDKTKDIVGGVVHDTWNSMKCGGALGAAFIPGHTAYKAIKNAGGVAKIVKILAGVDSKKGAASALGSGFSTLFGVKAIKKACFDGLR
ncbi:hypothetical protein [Streptomyces sp. enrichment culture]|uniref:hypothetical protein n=1 Tax=Streptomyces sp. enrichment culture TaxID=1795815 RepID=UPI003F5550C4